MGDTGSDRKAASNVIRVLPRLTWRGGRVAMKKDEYKGQR